METIPKDPEKVYAKPRPILTRAMAQQVAARDSAKWRAARPQSRPYLGFNGRDDLAARVASLRAATDSETVRLRDELSAAVDEILYRRWLRYFDGRCEVAWRERLLGFPLPTYRYPQELADEEFILVDARSELWQRDIGNALPALALGAYLFPDRRDPCIERMKGLALAALDFPTWGARTPYHDMDLSVDHLVRGIAIALDWQSEVWTESEKERLLAAVRAKLANLLRGAYGEAFWANGWAEGHCLNAFCAFGVAGVAFLDELPEAAEWLGAAIIGTRYDTEYKHTDGSSHEGVSYWSSGAWYLTQYIELTRLMTGSDSLYDLPTERLTGRFRMYGALPDLSGVLCFGDAVPTDYYGPAHTLYAHARQFRDPALQWFGDAVETYGDADVRAFALLWRDPTLRPQRPLDLPLDIHFPDSDIAISRSGWSADDYLLAVNSGFTNRNHKHLDAGALIFAWGGQWLIEAPGYGIIGPGFWDSGGPRWTFYANSTESHTTLLIDDQNQRFDPEARGTIVKFESAPDTCIIGIDLSDAYRGAHRVTRQILHRRGLSVDGVTGYVLVLDEIDAASESPGVHAQWLLQPGRTARIERDDTDTTHQCPAVRLIGESGTLTVRPIFGGAGFENRAPTSEHIDVPREAIRTLALSAQGRSVAFAVLIVTRRDDARATDAIQARIDEVELGRRRVTVSGPGFVDVLDPLTAN